MEGYEGSMYGDDNTLTQEVGPLRVRLACCWNSS